MQLELEAHAEVIHCMSLADNSLSAKSKMSGWNDCRTLGGAAFQKHGKS